MKIRGDTEGKEHTIAGYKQGGHFIIPTHRANRRESFDDKKPSEGTTSHKSKTFFMKNSVMKDQYEEKLKELKSYKKKLEKVEADKEKALKMMKRTKERTENNI